ncbi:DCC1 Sister chromatid cohesion protein DCC1 [Candida maltosa Xu316]
MVEYSVYQQLDEDPQYTYKLLQLPPSILSQLESGDVNLHIKSDIQSLALCTDSKTFKLRQMNHSNTVLLMNQHPDNKLIGYQKTSYEYELTEVAGVIDTSKIPVYEGGTSSSFSNSITIDQLKENSLCSEIEFQNNWYNLGGCEIDHKAYIMSRKVITELLYLLITKIMSLQLQSFTIEDILSIITPPYNEYMLISISHKFGTETDDKFILDDAKITHWFGIVELAKTNNMITQSEFLLNWKTSLPSFYNPPLDLIQLAGYYCSPMENRIMYVDPNTLSDNLGQRFKELFELDKNWKYEEFIPFIAGFVPGGKKVDSIILKFAKKKKVGKDKFIVCPR